QLNRGTPEESDACDGSSIKRCASACQATPGYSSRNTASGSTSAAHTSRYDENAQTIRPNQAPGLRPGRQVVYYFLHCQTKTRQVAMRCSRPLKTSIIR